MLYMLWARSWSNIHNPTAPKPCRGYHYHWSPSHNLLAFLSRALSIGYSNGDPARPHSVWPGLTLMVFDDAISPWTRGRCM